MNLNEYLNFKKGNFFIKDIYGTDSTSNIISDYIRMTKPNTCLEIGTGLGVTTFKIGKALSDNKKGELITIDNGKDWEEVKKFTPYNSLSYQDYINKLIKEFNLQDYVLFVNETLDYNLFYKTNNKIDFIFFDSWDSSAKGIYCFLRFYLNNMNEGSSILIDNGFKFLSSYLFIKNIINQFNNNIVPKSLIADLDKELIAKTESVIKDNYFNLFYLNNLNNKNQTGTIWIQLTKKDCLPNTYFEW